MPRTRTSSLSAAKVVAVTFLLIGSVFMAIGVGFGWFSWSLLAVAQRAEGTVIRLVPVQFQADDREKVAPVVEFHIGDERHEFQSWLSTSPPQFDVGEKVVVLYDRQNPEHARIESFVTLWLFPVVFGGIGAVMFLASIVIIGISWFRKPRASALVTRSGSDSVNFLDERTET